MWVGGIVSPVAMSNLNTRAWISLAVLALVMGLLVFVPARTIRYWQAWVYLSVFIGASVLTTLYLIRHDPALLERRMKGGPTAERRPTQKLIMLGTSMGFIGVNASGTVLCRSCGRPCLSPHD